MLLNRLSLQSWITACPTALVAPFCITKSPSRRSPKSRKSLSAVMKHTLRQDKSRSFSNGIALALSPSTTTCTAVLGAITSSAHRPRFGAFFGTHTSPTLTPRTSLPTSVTRMTPSLPPIENPPSLGAGRRGYTPSTVLTSAGFTLDAITSHLTASRPMSPSRGKLLGARTSLGLP